MARVKRGVTGHAKHKKIFKAAKGYYGRRKNTIRIAKQAVEKAKSTDTDKVIAAMAGQTYKGPDGFLITMDPKNHHLHKPVFIGEIKPDGQFNVVWKTPGPIKAQPWSPYIPEDKGKKDEPEKK